MVSLSFGLKSGSDAAVLQSELAVGSASACMGVWHGGGYFAG